MDLKLKNIHLIIIFFLLPLALLVLGDTNIHPAENNEYSPFGFVTQIQGARKGDKGQGIHHLRSYLQRFGYLHSKPQTKDIHDNEGTDVFDNQIESAIKAYQFNHSLKVTGVLDAETAAMMKMPRCGVPDVRRTPFGLQSRGNPTRPSYKTQLTYAFAPATRSDVMDPIANAFAQWASVTHFNFTLVQDFNHSDIKISFHKGDHGDGAAFDGPKGVFAHAFSPDVHFDADENWASGAQPNAFDIGTVGLHEIGHILGLQHTRDPGSIMFPTILPGTIKGLNSGDIRGIRALYNINA